MRSRPDGCSGVGDPRPPRMLANLMRPASPRIPGHAHQRLESKVVLG